MNYYERPGFYVEGRWFGDKFHQARARAAHLSKEYGRGIDVIQISHAEITPLRTLVCTVYNKASAA